jgi:hypothetical protein
MFFCSHICYNKLYLQAILCRPGWYSLPEGKLLSNLSWTFSWESLRSDFMNFHCSMQIVVHKGGSRGNHFRRAGPRQRVRQSCFLWWWHDVCNLQWEAVFSNLALVSVRFILNLMRSMHALSPAEDCALDLIPWLGKLYAAYLTCMVSPRYLEFR